MAILVPGQVGPKLVPGCNSRRLSVVSFFSKPVGASHITEKKDYDKNVSVEPIFAWFTHFLRRPFN